MSNSCIWPSRGVCLGWAMNKTPYSNKDMREKHYLCMKKRTDGLNFPV